MKPHEELFAIADHLASLPQFGVLQEAQKDLDALNTIASMAARAFSGSWQGYHAYVYYRDLSTPPPGAHFSQEWGLQDVFGMGSVGDWTEYDPEKLTRQLRFEAGNPDLADISEAARTAQQEFDDAKSAMISIFQSAKSLREDPYLERLDREIDELNPMTASDVIECLRPKRAVMTRDSVTLGQGPKTPPHIKIQAEVQSISHTFGICRKASSIARKAGSHLERQEAHIVSESRIGTNIFIGHGQSGIWRELKDFIQDRLHLPTDEFNRVPVAGITNQTRLAEMLDAAAVALVVMTAEDETKEGAVQARMNVIHEVGLFQGRLGFTRAIVLLEEGCEEFSNIQGLGQIRFHKGKISTCFEDVRRVLEREGLLSS